MPNKRFDLSRRRFLTRTVPAGAMVCLGCKGLFALPGQESKFSENPGMTTEEMYRFFYGTFIPALQTLAKSIGRDKLVKELTKASAEEYAQMMAAMAKDVPNKDMRAFVGLMDCMMATAPSNKAYTYETVESSDKVHELKFTQCLPAKIWREMNAADLGYAVECSPTDAIGQGFQSQDERRGPQNLDEG